MTAPTIEQQIHTLLEFKEWKEELAPLANTPQAIDAYVAELQTRDQANIIEELHRLAGDHSEAGVARVHELLGRLA